MNLLSFGEIIWDVCGDVATLGGAPLNFAAHAALQGEKVWLASAVGRDALGKKALEAIKSLGIKTDCVFVSDKHVTGECKVTLAENGMPSYRILENVAYDCIALPERLDGRFDVIAYGTLALREGHNREVLEKVLSANSFKEVFTDLNIRAPFYTKESIELCLQNGTIVKISEEELPVICEALWNKTFDVKGAAEMLKASYPQIKLLLITKGENGAVCYDFGSGDAFECGAEKTEVASTVGAGDSFGATFLTQYLKNGDVKLSMKAASTVSAFVVSRMGAIPEGIKEFLKSKKII